MSSPSLFPKLSPPPKKIDWSGTFQFQKIPALCSLFSLIMRFWWNSLTNREKGRSPLPKDHEWAQGIIRDFDKRIFNATRLVPDVAAQHYIIALYIVMRIADTIEDDPGKSAATRRKDLTSIHRFLDDPDYQPSCEYGINQKELNLMRSLPRVRSYCAQLSPSSRALVSECCRFMSEGMARFLPDEADDSALIKDFHDLEIYAYFAAGGPQLAMSRFYVAEGYEDEDIIPTTSPFSGHPDWQKDWGYSVFYPHCLIILDIATDTFASPQPRFFWPRSLVQKYVKDQRELFLPENEQLALDCLNEFIINALQHVVAALTWQGKHQSQFLKIAQPIPFLHHLFGLTLYYNNPDVFRFRLKSNLVELACAVGNCQDFEGLIQQTKIYCRKFLEKSGPNDRHRLELEKVVNQTLAGCDILLRKEKRAKSAKTFNGSGIIWWGLILICGLSLYLNWSSKY